MAYDKIQSKKKNIFKSQITNLITDPKNRQPNINKCKLFLPHIQSFSSKIKCKQNKSHRIYTIIMMPSLPPQCIIFSCILYITELFRVHTPPTFLSFIPYHPNQNVNLFKEARKLDS